jgi:hypothetical protein
MDSGGEEEGSDSELSDTERNFLTKGAFLLTPSNELTLEKAEAIVDKMNFRAPFSLTKTATGILFKFAEPDDCAAVYKKGFHKVSATLEGLLCVFPPSLLYLLCSNPTNDSFTQIKGAFHFLASLAFCLFCAIKSFSLSVVEPQKPIL